MQHLSNCIRPHLIVTGTNIDVGLDICSEACTVHENTAQLGSSQIRHAFYLSQLLVLAVGGILK